MSLFHPGKHFIKGMHYPETQAIRALKLCDSFNLGYNVTYSTRHASYLTWDEAQDLHIIILILDSQATQMNWAI